MNFKIEGNLKYIIWLVNLIIFEIFFIGFKNRNNNLGNGNDGIINFIV